MQELEKILEEIEQAKREPWYRLNNCDVRHKLDGAINRIVDIIRKHMKDGWIPVEERLPIPNKEIWVTVKRNGNVFTSTDGMTEKGHFWNYEKENILAWKEKELIPEPYRPERRIKMLELVPISLKEANAFVEQHHRHHKPVVGHKFSVAAAKDGEIVGVAIVGRPVSRYLDDGWTLEVNRLCTDGTRNACSFLYAAAWRCARNMGYKKLITYTLDSETGSSLKATGWKCVGKCGGKRWTGVRRPEVDLYPAQMKLRFEIEKRSEGK